VSAKVKLADDDRDDSQRMLDEYKGRRGGEDKKGMRGIRRKEGGSVRDSMRGAKALLNVL
jgi:hypothetical protein